MSIQPQPPPKRKSVEDFQFGARIGEGSYSTVYSARDIQLKKTFAVKVLSKTHVVKENKVKYVNIEKTTLHRLGQQHPGIVQLYYTFQDEQSLFFVLDFAEYGELLSIIRKFGSLSETVTKFYMCQIIDAVRFIHSKGVIHRDLKPENILVNHSFCLKITDFGAAKLLEEKDGSYADDRSKGSFVGTAEYVSPELLKDNLCGFEADVWALGCILFQFFHGTPPFQGSTEYLTFEKIIKSEFSYRVSLAKEITNIIDRVLVADPQKRWTIADIQKAPWFQDVPWDDANYIWYRKVPRFEPYGRKNYPVHQLDLGLIPQMGKRYQPATKIKKVPMRPGHVMPNIQKSPQHMQNGLNGIPNGLNMPNGPPNGPPGPPNGPGPLNNAMPPMMPKLQTRPSAQRNSPIQRSPSSFSHKIDKDPATAAAAVAGRHPYYQHVRSTSEHEEKSPGLHSPTLDPKDDRRTDKRENQRNGESRNKRETQKTNNQRDVQTPRDENLQTQRESDRKNGDPRNASLDKSDLPYNGIRFEEICSLLAPEEKILKMDLIFKSQLSNRYIERSGSSQLDSGGIDDLLRTHKQKLQMDRLAVVAVVTNRARVFLVDGSLNVSLIDLKANHGSDYSMYDYEFETAEDEDGLVESYGYLILELVRDGGDLIFLRRLSRMDKMALLDPVSVVDKNGKDVTIGANHGWIDCLLMAKDSSREVDKKEEKKKEDKKKDKARNEEKRKEPKKEKEVKRKSTRRDKAPSEVKKNFAYAAAAAAHK